MNKCPLCGSESDMPFHTCNRSVNPIESAPKDGTEILVWREDSGWLLARWIAPCDFLHEGELARMGIKDAEEPDWFCADFISGGRLDGGAPTHWMPMPEAPQIIDPQTP